MAYVPPHRRGKQQSVTSKDVEITVHDGARAAASTISRTTISRWAGALVQDTIPAASTARISSAKRATTTCLLVESSSHSSNSTTMTQQQHNPQNSPSSSEDLDILNKAFHRICCINLDTRVDKWKMMQQDAEKVGSSFQQRIERISAIEGKTLIFQDDIEDDAKKIAENTCFDKNVAHPAAASIIDNVCLEWDGTTDAKYNRHGRPGTRTMTPSEAGCALSHAMLWKQLANSSDCTVAVALDAAGEQKYADNPAILILEDDARFSHYRGRSRFAKAFAKAYEMLPEEWGFLYLGLSDRGERTWLDKVNNADCDDVMTGNEPYDRASNPQVRLYKPEYGYHTHAYAIRKDTAAILVENLPICGPIDVWLADNQWFSQPAYCAVIAGEGWKLDDGTYEGNDLVIQERRGIANDIEHC